VGSGTGIFGTAGLDAAGCKRGSAMGWLDDQAQRSYIIGTRRDEG
jgi:hypothetical protein